MNVSGRFPLAKALDRTVYSSTRETFEQEREKNVPAWCPLTSTHHLEGQSKELF